MCADDQRTNAKEALCCAAQKLFSEKGYAAVSTREIADTAQVNLGAIQYHFGGKEQLFIQMIHSLMKEKHQANPLFSDEVEIDSRETAACELVRFVRAFLDDMCHPKGPDACRLMFREVLSSTPEQSSMFEALVSSVVQEFIKPTDDRLRTIVQMIVPGASDHEVSLCIHSIIGQCSFYVTHRPFIERLRNTDFADAALFRDIVLHVAKFTLQGLGLTPEEIKNALHQAEPR